MTTGAFRRTCHEARLVPGPDVFVAYASLRWRDNRLPAHFYDPYIRGSIAPGEQATIEWVPPKAATLAFITLTAPECTWIRSLIVGSEQLVDPQASLPAQVLAPDGALFRLDISIGLGEKLELIIQRAES